MFDFGKKIGPPAGELESLRPIFEKLKRAEFAGVDLSRSEGSYNDSEIEREWIDWAETEYLSLTGW